MPEAGSPVYRKPCTNPPAERRKSSAWLATPAKYRPGVVGDPQSVFTAGNLGCTPGDPGCVVLGDGEIREQLLGNGLCDIVKQGIRAVK